MMARRGDTKPLCHGAHASVALPAVRLWPLSGVKSLVLCQPGSQGTLLAYSSRRRWGSLLSLGRSMYQSVSLVVVGLQVHEWAVLRIPSLHEMSAAKEMR